MEFIEVAGRPKFKKYFSSVDLQELMLQIGEHAEFIKVTSIVKLCRGPKDNFLLSLCKDGKATYLLTGDQDLLELMKVEKTTIISMKFYLSIS